MAEMKMQLVDWLDDLCVRFIINLPEEELESVERICFQVEEAQWFYEDFVRPLDPTLPSLSLKQFCLLVFQHCPMFAHFSEYHHITAFSEFLVYKTRVPVRGAIMLNQAMDSVVLVKGWKKNANWSFPRGKINKDETDLDCAVREVYEETGYDIVAAGLVEDAERMKFIEVSMREQHMKLYVFRGVPEDTVFQPRTRKEISKIQWYKLSELPSFKKKKLQQQGQNEYVVAANKFYMVAPFLTHLKKWIAHQRKLDARKRPGKSHLAPHLTQDDLILTEEEDPLTAEETDHYIPDDTRQSLGYDLHASNLGNAGGVSNPQTERNDPATELKRLLSVGQSNAQPPETNATNTTASHPEALLALFRQGPQHAHIDPQIRTLIPPRAPLDQMTINSPEPNSPHHYHPQPQPFSHMPPPPELPFSPDQVSTNPRVLDQQYQHQTYQRTDNGPRNAHYNSNYIPKTQFSPRQGFVSQAQSHLPILQQSQLEPPRPYQRIEDPLSAQTPHFPGHTAPSIPPASDLPAPSLSKHALSLLNAFKSDGKSAQPALHSPSLQHWQESITVPGRADFPTAARVWPISEFSDRTGEILADQTQLPLAASHHLRNNSALSPIPVEIASPPAPPRANSKPNTQQSALLKLFRPSSERQEPRFGNAGPNVLKLADPAELAAAPSPMMGDFERPFHPPQPVRPYAQAAKNALPTGKPNSAVEGGRANGGNPVSATVTGPLDTPNFGPARGTMHDRKSNQDALAEEPPKTTPITILKRPSSSQGAGASRTPAPRSPISNQKTEKSQNGAKTFQPKILQRPQQFSKPTSLAAGQEVNPMAPMRQVAPKDNHKQVLLDLFRKPSLLASPPIDLENPSPIISPVSIKSRPASATKSPRPMSRANSSAPTLHTPLEELEQLSMNGNASSQGQPRTSGTTSPISSMDKSFLLGYLNGVVKSAGR